MWHRPELSRVATANTADCKNVVVDYDPSIHTQMDMPKVRLVPCETLEGNKVVVQHQKRVMVGTLQTCFDNYLVAHATDHKSLPNQPKPMGKTLHAKSCCPCVTKDKHQACVCKTCDTGERALTRLAKAHTSDKQLCPPGKCRSKCKCKCTGSGTVDDGGSTVPCSCKHPCPADCACRDASSALGRVLAVAARGDIGAYMGAVFQCPKEELCGKRVHPLGCVEGNTCTCWKDFVDQFNSCKCNQATGNEFVWKMYSTVVRSKFEQEMVVNCNYKGDKHVRADFSAYFIKVLAVLHVHWWTDRWQSHSKGMILPQMGPHDLDCTADFVSKHEHKPDVSGTCDTFWTTTLLATRVHHSPTMQDVNVKPPRHKIVADAHSVKPVPAAIERQAFFGQKGTAPVKKLTFKRDSHMSLFEDKQQDNLSFTHAMKAVWQFYIALLTTVSCVFMSSDQCAGQFHGRRNYGTSRASTWRCPARR